MKKLRPGLSFGLLFGLLFGLPASSARADTVKPRFVILVDTSGSMTQNAAQTPTHGDGSLEHPGCDLDGNGLYDDSKMFQAKAALADTLVAFGGVEFALARYHQNELGQACTSSGQCNRMLLGANVCVGGHCGFSISSTSPDYNECNPGEGRGCVRCADPDNDPTQVWYNGSNCCLAGEPTSGGFGLAGDVVVPFPTSGPNLAGLQSWIDDHEDFPAGTNKELRASGTTPIGGSLNAVRDWLVNDASTVGAGAGVLNRDDRGDCRSYNVILITDGLEVNQCVTNCRINATRAADLLFHSCTNNGIWNTATSRCEIGGSPLGTREIKVRTYVVGFTVDDPQLNAIAAAGGTGTALLANNQAELTARLGDIVAQSIPVEKCDCQDNTCDGLVDETFRAKGDTCTVGVGRCKRQGRWGCKADGTGLTCSASPIGICPAADLQPGTPVAEVCGAAPGCEAPTAEDCADDNCDGIADENMSCACAAKPEVCNGLDDDCNGKIDDVAPVKCGLDIGECRPGITACVVGPNGPATVCNGATPPTPEICDNKDNDCDGLIDSFGLACFPANTVGCKLTGAAVSCGSAPAESWSCQGVCRTGVVTCAGGVCGRCEGAVAPSPEVACDGVDNDCDGQIDEGFGLGEPCGAGLGGKGPCKPGVQMCVDGALKCVGGVAPTDETCNGVDDDCDGTVDDIPGVCGLLKGECKPGHFVCEKGTPVCTQPDGPTVELCDGKDNNCNGQIDEDPQDPDLLSTTPCGSTVGICKPGILRCVGGGKYCEGGVEPVAETCNGLDDDCDGNVDEGINPPGACGAPGLPVGSVIRGECRPGANVCVSNGAGGAHFACTGGVGPVAELCDGKDNNCNGQIDDNATCATNQGCADGECVARCGRPGDPACPAGRMCADGLCRFAECVRTPCQPGFRCDSARGCIDRCEDMTCPGNTRCQAGECVSCYVRGCPSGQVCRDDQCVVSPCSGSNCGGGFFCRDGTCVADCLGVSCGDGQVCRDGACVGDVCAGKACAAGTYCEPKDGTCHTDPCASISCLPGLACVPGQGACVSDPCAVTLCPAGQACVVRVDGLADCLAAAQVTAGGGCGCDVGGRPGGGIGLSLLAAVAVVIARRRRR